MKLLDRIYLFFKRIWHVLIYPVIYRYRMFKNRDRNKAKTKEREDNLENNVKAHKIIIKIKMSVIDDENKENIDPIKKYKTEAGLRNKRLICIENLKNVLPRQSPNVLTNCLRIIKRL